MKKIKEIELIPRWNHDIAFKQGQTPCSDDFKGMTLSDLDTWLKYNTEQAD